MRDCKKLLIHDETEKSILRTIILKQSKTQKTWWNDQQEMRRVSNFLAKVGRKHEEELNAGKPVNLKLAKVRRHD